jgi:hypothetical protein
MLCSIHRTVLALRNAIPLQEIRIPELANAGFARRRRVINVIRILRLARGTAESNVERCVRKELVSHICVYSIAVLLRVDSCITK